MDPTTEFTRRIARNIESIGADSTLRDETIRWINRANVYQYTYNFSALGRPIIQFPQDMVAMQELIWRIRPDLIIETGIAHGGSLILNASMLALLDYCDALSSGQLLDPQTPKRRVLGVDIDIRAHNRQAIEAHPMANRIDMIQGSSTDPEIVAKVRERASGFQRVLVSLDSNHTHHHVLSELEAYAPLVSVDSYCVVFDTLIEDVPAGSFSDRPWDKGDNPKTAVWEYLKSHPEFQIDASIPQKLLITAAPDGYLRRRTV